MRGRGLHWAMQPTPEEIIAFWTQAGPTRWFARSDAFDVQIRERFEAAHHAAARGELDAWTGTAQGALALLLLLDQFPRNLFRGSAHAYATDGKARAIADIALAAGHERDVDAILQPFFLLPFEHSEDLAHQDRAVALAEALQARTGDARTLQWARLHRDVIARFGRFAHRNAALGRAGTPEEIAFLAAGGFAG